MTTPFTIKITSRAERDLARLPEKAATACVEFLFGPLAADPYRVGKPLKDRLAGLHSARRGAYRVVYRIENTVCVVNVIHINHRKDVYR
jgi:mRNA-degrading endonuclease RelE of RelBE toxin-antitoxin system